MFLFIVTSCGAGNGKDSQSTSNHKQEQSATKELRPLELNPTITSKSIRPQDDFYTFANQPWLDKTTLGERQVIVNNDTELMNYGLRPQLKRLIDDILTKKVSKLTHEEQILRDVYKSYMDTQAMSENNFKSLEKYINAINHIHNKNQLFSFMATLDKLNIHSPLSFTITHDLNNTKHYIGDIKQGGLTMPYRYYLKKGDRYDKVRKNLRFYMSNLLNMANIKHPRTMARNLLALEIKLAKIQQHHKPPLDLIDRYNQFTYQELQNLAPNIKWKSYLHGVGFNNLAKPIVVEQPLYFQRLDDLIKNTPLNLWKVYLNWRLLDHFADILNTNFISAQHEFHQQIKEVHEIDKRWRKGLQMLATEVSELMYKTYTNKYFDENRNKEVVYIVNKIKNQLLDNVKNAKWLSDEAKDKAVAKLNNLNVHIATADNLHEYSELQTTDDNLLKNLINIRLFHFEKNMAIYNNKIHDHLWIEHPHKSSIRYYNMSNILVVPSTILQPPFFNLDLKNMEHNYGVFGFIIARELSNAILKTGSRYDTEGNIGKWWTHLDYQNYDKITKETRDYFNKYIIMKKDHDVYPTLTFEDHILNLSGLQTAIQVYKQTNPDYDKKDATGLSGLQKFLIYFAQTWRTKLRNDYLEYMVNTMVRTPSKKRINHILSDNSDFYKAFAVKKTDKMYLQPNKRSQLW